MRSGLLQESIVVERNHLHRDEFGAENTVWECHIRTKARVDDKGGNNIIENDERVFTRSLTFTVRIYHDIRNLDRIIWDGKKYQIQYIEKRKKEHSQVITATLINE